MKWFLCSVSALTTVLLIYSTAQDKWVNHNKLDQASTDAKFSFGIWHWEVDRLFVMSSTSNVSSGSHEVKCKKGFYAGVNEVVDFNQSVSSQCEMRCNFKKSASIIAPVFAFLATICICFHGSENTYWEKATFVTVLIAFAFNLTILSLYAQEIGQKNNWNAVRTDDVSPEVGLCAFGYSNANFDPAWGPSYQVAIASTVTLGLISLVSAQPLVKSLFSEVESFNPF
jgi:hypothetical protein